MNSRENLVPAESEDQIADALRDLVAHPGFAILQAHAREEWGEVAQIARMKHEPSNTWPQVIACSEAVAQMLAWPARELERRKTLAAEAAVKPPLVPRRA